MSLAIVPANRTASPVLEHARPSVISKKRLVSRPMDTLTGPLYDAVTAAEKSLEPGK